MAHRVVKGNLLQLLSGAFLTAAAATETLYDNPSTTTLIVGAVVAHAVAFRNYEAALAPAAMAHLAERVLCAQTVPILPPTLNQE